MKSVIDLTELQLLNISESSADSSEIESSRVISNFETEILNIITTHSH